MPHEMIEFARNVIHTMQRKYGDNSLTRTRVDLFASANGFVLCELECTEPNTNIQRINQPDQDKVIDNYASAVYTRAGYLKEQV